MAYLILEESGSGNESAYFEFNAENEASVEKLESLLVSRLQHNGRAVDEFGIVAEQSYSTACRKKHGVWNSLCRIVQGLFSGGKGPLPASRCACGHKGPAPCYPSGITRKGYSLVS